MVGDEKINQGGLFNSQTLNILREETLGKLVLLQTLRSDDPIYSITFSNFAWHYF